MKKIIFVLFAVISILDIEAMNLGKAQILTCPYCSSKKEIMSVTSGNTIGAVYWSDNKRIAPMLPEISDIQKCLECKKYYFINRQKTVYSDSITSENRGTLSWPELKEAYHLLSAEDSLSENEHITLNFMLFQGYNDYYYRTSKEAPTIDPADYALFCQCGQWIIDNAIKDNIMKAEFYRETGQYDKALAILPTDDHLDGFLLSLVRELRKRCQEKNPAVFLIKL